MTLPHCREKWHSIRSSITSLYQRSYSTSPDGKRSACLHLQKENAEVTELRDSQLHFFPMEKWGITK